MAKDKKGFVLYADLLTVVEKLVTQDRENKTNYAGELFLHILKYVNDKNPIPINFIIEMAFEPIKLQLKRDLEKYEQVKVKRSQAGKKSAELRALKSQQKSTNSTSVESVQQSSTNPTVIDTVNVTDIVTVKDIKEYKKKNVFNFRKSLLGLGADKELLDGWLKVRKTKKATNSETAFKLLVSEFNKSSLDVNQILTLCVSSDWKGFKSNWVKNHTSKPNNKTNGIVF